MEQQLTKEQLKEVLKKLQNDEHLQHLYERLRRAYRNAEVTHYAFDKHKPYPVFKAPDQARINYWEGQLKEYRDKVYGEQAVHLGF